MLAMPNTTPAIDTAKNVEILREIIKKTAHANVFMSGAITRDRKGKELVDITQLKKEGVIAISDDGASVDNAQVMLEALEIAKKEKIVVTCHCEDISLAAKGVVNLGFTSTRMGLRGISSESEYTRVARDIELADKVKAPIHIAHVSCKESVEIIAIAKLKGIQVTCETAPHYFTLSEEAAWDYNTNTKINPPLRTKVDVEAIKKALKDGTIDAIASDHAPHTENEKDIEFDYAAFGSVGLETELALAITELVKGGLLDWPELVRKLSLNPSKILGINKGTLSLGAEADVIVVSPQAKWTVEKSGLISKSKNSMFIGRELEGSVEYTILRGKVVYSAFAPIRKKQGLATTVSL